MTATPRAPRSSPRSSRTPRPAARGALLTLAVVAVGCAHDFSFAPFLDTGVVIPTECPGREIGSAVGSGVVSGTTVGGPRVLTATCGGSAMGPEATFGWTAPAQGSYTIDTVGSAFDTVLHLHSDTCTGPELVCNDDGAAGNTSLVTRDFTAGERVVIVVDTYSTNPGGSYVLNIRAN